MPRRVQDIVPSDKRSIRDIPVKDLPIRRISILEAGSKEKFNRKNNGSRKMWRLIFVGIVIIVVGAAYIASSFFSRAVFTIVPKSISIVLNGPFVAQNAASTTEVLAYELLPLQASASTTVPAVDGAPTNTKAQGKIVLYNSYAKQTQKLVAGTRLASDAGLIYRLTSSVVIPGYAISGAGILVPGSVSAQIVASEPGENYNVAKTATGNFKIVAYKGSSKYDLIYAKLSTDITGGFSGIKKTVSPAVIASSTATLKAQLVKTLLEKAKSNIPAGYIMYDGAYSIETGAPTIGSGGSKNAVISLSVALNAILFKKSDLVTRVAGTEAIAPFGTYGYTPEGLDSLQFSITNIKDFSANKKTTLIIRLKGPLKIVATVPVEEIKKKLAGQSLSETQNIFKSYNSVIKSASGELKPTWSKVPSDLSRITVVTKEE